ncbi:CLIP domain-containing serine protease B4-like isoform X1 [Arctopsyche grandis]|uniref:CLIP domain-containing serine protease B4-like isoform X1 n=1 Tax=Arctopsyche grandis TaxID=121162 RepID=UPI00406D9A32
MIGIFQKANCGYEGKNPKLCCPIENNFVTEESLPTTTESQKVVVNFESKFGRDDDASESCTTEWNTEGECVLLPNCDHYNAIWNAAKASKNLRTVTNQLAKVRCGFVDGIPLVCCPFQIMSRNTGLSGSAKATTKSPTTTSTTTTESLKTTISTTTTRKPNIENKFNILPSKCGEIENDRITAGNKTGIFEYPWMTLIAIPPEPNLEATFNCGGSIIHERYILTAAHCFKFSKPTKVRVGEHNVKTDIDCEGEEDDLDCASPPQNIDVEETVIHPMYNKPRKQNDIALLRLKTPIDFTKNNVMAICLPLSEKLRNLKVIDIDMIVAGWGMTENFTLSEKLLQARIPVVANSKCAIGRRTMSENQLCAGGETKADSCGGDSGGPLMHASDVNGVTKIVQQGIVSFGSIACGTIGAPAVYTYVAKYIDWILNEIKN